MLATGFDRQRNVLLLTPLDTFDDATLAVTDAACVTFFDAEAPLGLGPLVFEAAGTSWLADNRARAS